MNSLPVDVIYVGCFQVHCLLFNDEIGAKQQWIRNKGINRVRWPLIAAVSEDTPKLQLLLLFVCFFMGFNRTNCLFLGMHLIGFLSSLIHWQAWIMHPLLSVYILSCNTSDINHLHICTGINKMVQKGCRIGVQF